MMRRKIAEKIFRGLSISKTCVHIKGTKNIQFKKQGSRVWC
jgi:hypothetical protein